MASYNFTERKNTRKTVSKIEGTDSMNYLKQKIAEMEKEIIFLKEKTTDLDSAVNSIDDDIQEHIPKYENKKGEIEKLASSMQEVFNIHYSSMRIFMNMIYGQDDEMKAIRSTLTRISSILSNNINNVSTDCDYYNFLSDLRDYFRSFVVSERNYFESSIEARDEIKKLHEQMSSKIDELKELARDKAVVTAYVNSFLEEK